MNQSDKSNKSDKMNQSNKSKKSKSDQSNQSEKEKSGQIILILKNMCKLAGKYKTFHYHVNLIQQNPEQDLSQIKSNRNRTIFVEPGNLTEFKCGTNKADLITICDGLHRVRYQSLLFNDLARIIKIGGLLFIKDYNMDSLNDVNLTAYLDLVYILKEISNGREIDQGLLKNYYRRYISFEELKNILERIGFQMVSFYAYDNKNNPQRLYYALFIYNGGQLNYSDIKLVSKKDMFCAAKGNLVKWINREKKKITKLECVNKMTTVTHKGHDFSLYYYYYIEKAIELLFSIDKKMLTKILWLVNNNGDLDFFRLIKSIHETPQFGIINNWKNLTKERLICDVEPDLILDSEDFESVTVARGRSSPKLSDYENSSSIIITATNATNKRSIEYENELAMPVVPRGQSESAGSIGKSAEAKMSPRRSSIQIGTTDHNNKYLNMPKVNNSFNNRQTTANWDRYAPKGRPTRRASYSTASSSPHHK